MGGVHFSSLANISYLVTLGGAMNETIIFTQQGCWDSGSILAFAPDGKKTMSKH
jgi:hypothetical protein